jgi:hypothetical protein
MYVRVFFLLSLYAYMMCCGEMVWHNASFQRVHRARRLWEIRILDLEGCDTSAPD